MSIAGISAGTAIATLTLNSSPFSAGIASAKQQLKTFADSSNSTQQRIASLGSAVNTVGVSMTKSFTLPIMGAGAASVKFASDFETSGNKVATIADASVISMDKLQKKVLDLSNNIGIAATDLNETLYQTISATGDTANALDYVEIASKAAIGGFTDTTTAVDGLTTVLNAYQLKGTKAMQAISDQMLVAQNYGKTTFGEMASSIGNVIPIAASLKVSTEELFGSIATLTKNGIGTSEAITGLKAALSNIIKPSSEATKLANELGLEFNAAHLQSVGWAQFLQEVQDKTGGSSEKMAQLFGSVEALNSVTVLATTGAKDFAGALDAMSGSAGQTDKAFDTMNQGSGKSIKDMLNSLKNLAISFGQVLAPAVTSIVEKIQGIINWLNSLSDSQRNMIVTIALVIAAIGPVLAIVGQVITLVSTLGTVFTFLASPIGLIILAIAALAAAVYLIIKNWEPIKKFFIDLWDKVKNAFVSVWNAIVNFFTGINNSIRDFIIGTWNAIVNFFVGINNSIRDFIIGAWNSIINFFMTINNSIRDFIIGAWNAVLDFFISINNSIRDFIVGVWIGIRDFFIKAVTTIANTAKSIWESIKNAVETVFTAIKDFIVSIFEGVVSFFTGLPGRLMEAGVNAFNALKDGISSVITKVKDTIVSGINNAISFITGLPSRMIEFGKNTIDGLINGIKSKIAAVKDTIKNVVSAATDGIKNFLGIHSPSKVMMEFGEYTGEGFAIGIAKQDSMVKNAVQSLGAAATDIGASIPGQTSTDSTESSTIPNISDGQPVILRFELVNSMNGREISREIVDYVAEELAVNATKSNYGLQGV